jgi:hypothetical protein
MISDPHFMSIEERLRVMQKIGEVAKQWAQLRREGLSKEEVRARLWSMSENTATDQVRSEDPQPGPYPA